MDRIAKLTVTYQDGTTQTWEGKGTSSVERTGNTDSNLLKDHNTHYVTAKLQFTPPKETTP